MYRAHQDRVAAIAERDRLADELARVRGEAELRGAAKLRGLGGDEPPVDHSRSVRVDRRPTTQEQSFAEDRAKRDRDRLIDALVRITASDQASAMALRNMAAAALKLAGGES